MGARSGIQLCYPFEEKRLARWGSTTVIVQPKLDGERCRAIITYGQVQLLSSERNEIFSVPHIIEELGHMFKDTTIELDGELYCHGMDFPSIHSIISRKENLHPDYSKMQFHIFDTIQDGMTIDRIMQLPTFLYFGTSRPDPQIIEVVSSNLVEASTQAILSMMNSFIQEGYEGIIVRHPHSAYVRKRSPFIMKFKPKKEDIYRIVSFKQLQDKNGNYREELGSFICTSDEGTIFSVGSGLTQRAREVFWNIRDCLAGNYLRVQYQHTNKGAPRFPIYMEIVDPRELPSKN